MPANKALPVFAVSSKKMSPLCSLAGNSGSYLPLICESLVVSDFYGHSRLESGYLYT